MTAPAVGTAPRYPLYLASYFLMAIAASMAGVAMSFGVLAKTGSTALLAINLALYFLPALLSPISGAAVDRYGTRPVLAASIAARVVLLTAFAATVAWWTAPASVAVLMTITLLVGILKLPTSPAMRKVFTRTLPADRYVKGNAHLSIAGQAGGALSFLLVGAAIDRFDAPVVLATAAGVFGLVGVLTWPLAHATRSPNSTAPTRRLAVDTAGFVALRTSPVLLSSTAMTLATVVAFSPTEALLPGQMEDQGHGASGFTHFLLAYSLGVLAGGVLIGRLDDPHHARRLVPAAGVVLGLAVAGLSLSAGMVVLLTLGLVMGNCCAMFESVAMARIHQHAEEAVQGRVFAALHGTESIVQAGVLGLIAAATALGVGRLLWLAAAVPVLVLTAWAVTRPGRDRLPEREPVEAS
ncbi:MFS transporter [Streptomyces sp. NPDC055897]